MHIIFIAEEEGKMNYGDVPSGENIHVNRRASSLQEAGLSKIVMSIVTLPMRKE